MIAEISHAELDSDSEEAYLLYNELMTSYRQCIQSVDKYNYWKYKSGCYLVDGNIGGGGCDESTDKSMLQEYVPATHEHCLAYKPTKDEFYEMLND